MKPLLKVIKAFNTCITGGSEHGWNIYGPATRYLDFTKAGQENSTSPDQGHCVFDVETQNVFEIELWTRDGKAYRWIDPMFMNDYRKECKKRKVDFLAAYDDVKFIVYNDYNDMIKHVKRVFGEKK